MHSSKLVFLLSARAPIPPPSCADVKGCEVSAGKVSGGGRKERRRQRPAELSVRGVAGAPGPPRTARASPGPRLWTGDEPQPENVWNH